MLHTGKIADSRVMGGREGRFGVGLEARDSGVVVPGVVGCRGRLAHTYYYAYLYL